MTDIRMFCLNMRLRLQLHPECQKHVFLSTRKSEDFLCLTFGHMLLPVHGWMVVGGMGGKGTECIKPRRFWMEPDLEIELVYASFSIYKEEIQRKK
jgi:hypothetical protein